MRGTVRSTKDSAKTEDLHKLAAALPGTLELHEADLLQEGSFDDVVKGSHYVFHTASPVVTTPKDPQRDLVRLEEFGGLIKFSALPLGPACYLGSAFQRWRRKEIMTSGSN